MGASMDVETDDGCGITEGGCPPVPVFCSFTGCTSAGAECVLEPHGVSGLEEFRLRINNQFSILNQKMGGHRPPLQSKHPS
jgi:hypothetical protein